MERIITMKKNPVSIIICTYKRNWRLISCLEHIKKQKKNLDLTEIIVVDNDRYSKLFNSIKSYSRFFFLRYKIESKIGLSNARNTGARIANGDYLAFIDDDVCLPENYLSILNSVIKKYHPDIFGGPVYPKYDTNKPFWFRDEYETRKYVKKSRFIFKESITGANFIIKKSVYNKLGGCDPTYGMTGNKQGLGEERKLLEKYRKETQKINQRIYYCLELWVNHSISQYKLNLNYRILRSFSNGRVGVKIRRDLDGKSVNKLAAMLRLLSITPFFVLSIFKSIINHNKNKFDLVQLIIHCSCEFGIAAESFFPSKK